MVYHSDADASQVEDFTAVARSPAGVVGGAEEPGRVLQQIPNLGLAKGVVSKGHRVGPGVPDTLRLFPGEAHAGGVFPVDHGKGDILELLQGPQDLFQVAKPGLSHHVAHGENVIQHKRPPI